MDGTVVQVLSDSQLDPGIHQFGFSPVTTGLGGTRAFQCAFAATSTVGDTLLYEASQVVLYYSPVAEMSVIGETSSEGRFETTDRLNFPHLLDLPPLQAESAEGESLFMFSVPETVVIALTDTFRFRAHTAFHVTVITQGVNDYEFAWVPNRMRHVALGNGARPN
jgi:hypothetical protein